MSDVFPPQAGGSGRWLWELYRRFPEGNVTVVAGKSAGAEEFDQTHELPLTRMQFPISSWGIAGLQPLREFRAALRRLREVIRENRPRELHCGKCLPEGLLGLAIKLRDGLPYQCYVHGEELAIASASRELKWLTRRVLRNADRVIANSRNTASMITDDWDVPTSSVHVMHPGVDANWFVPAPRDPETRRKLSWADRPVILTVGRLQKRKGQDQLIRALPRIMGSIPNILYCVIGSGEERESLEQLVAELDLHEHVQFVTGASDEQMRTCYQQCELFVLPNRTIGSDFEGFGIVLLEAQSCGKPVVAGTSGGTHETMEIDHTGQLVDCEDVDALGEVVSDLLVDEPLRERMGRYARSWITENFDWPERVAHAQRAFTGSTPQVGAACRAALHGSP